MADQYTRRALSAMLGSNVVYTLYPVIGAGVSRGVVTTGGAANTFGADKEVIAAGAITVPFWFCQVQLDTTDQADSYVVDIEIAGTTTLYSCRFDVTAVTMNIGPYGPPFPVAVPASSQITARQASVTGGKVIGVSVLVATGL
jgi:hypothetical protein